MTKEEMFDAISSDDKIMCFLNEWGISIYNSDGTKRSAYEILKEVSETCYFN